MLAPAVLSSKLPFCRYEHKFFLLFLLRLLADNFYLQRLWRCFYLHRSAVSFTCIAFCNAFTCRAGVMLSSS